MFAITADGLNVWTKCIRKARRDSDNRVQTFGHEVASAPPSQPIESMGKRGKPPDGAPIHKIPKLKTAQDSPDNPAPFESDWQDVATAIAGDFVSTFKGPITIIQKAWPKMGRSLVKTISHKTHEFGQTSRDIPCRASSQTRVA